MQLNEDLLYYIWQFRLLLKPNDFYCTNAEPLRVIYPGSPNFNAGPDFSSAKLSIGGQVWVGNVEIHVRSSDWLLHGHQRNKAYDSVILHVVYENDAVICRTDGTAIPVFVVKGLIPEAMLVKYEQLMGKKNFFPCSKQIGIADPRVIKEMLDGMVNDRFREKVDELDKRMSRNSYYWNEAFYELLMKNFGFKVNALPFEMLATSLPSTILAKHRDHPVQVEALLFGQAGFLEGEFIDSYPRQLQTEYLFLQKKYQLVPLNRSIWKFLRMHPQNFPVLRIAQVAGLLISRQHLFADLLAEKDLKKLKAVFFTATVHSYWQDHSDFDRQSKHIPTRLGKQSIENILINTVCLMWYSYGKYFSDPELIERAVALLKKIPAENNAIITKYCESGLKSKHAYDSQAVLQLYKTYCVQKKCLNCLIGIHILTK